MNLVVSSWFVSLHNIFPHVSLNLMDLRDLSLKWFQGVLGIKVKIMLDWDPKGKQGPMTPLPDLVTIHPPKDEEEYKPPEEYQTVVPPTNIEIPVA